MVLGESIAMKQVPFLTNDNCTYWVAGTTAALIALMPFLSTSAFPGDGKVAPPAIPMTKAATPAGAPPAMPPLLLGQVGKDYAECMKFGNVSLVKASYKMAGDNYRQALKFMPNDPSAHLGLGHALHGLGLDDEALLEYFEALKCKQDLYPARFYIGAIMMKRETWDEAAGQFLQIIKAIPTDLPARGNLGVCYMQKGQMDAAIDQFKYIVSVDQKNVDGFYNLACAYDLKQDFRSAAENYKKVIQINPKHALAYTGLAKCFTELRDFKNAEKIYLLALNIDKPASLQNHYAYIGLGRVYELMGKDTDATKQYQKAIAVAPRAPECQKLMQNMLKTKAQKLGLSGLAGFN